MPNFIPVLQPTESDAALLQKLARTERIALSAVVCLIGTNLVGWLGVLVGWNFPGSQHLMKGESLLVVLLCMLSLGLTGRQRWTALWRLGLLLAATAALVSAAVLCESVFHTSFGFDVPAAGGTVLSMFAARMSVATASGFVLLGITLLAIPARRQPAVAIADLLMFCLILLVLILVSGHIVASLKVASSTSTVTTSALSMLALLLLTVVAFLRKAERGVYSILLGRGIGSNIARWLSPVLLVLPYLREAARARIIGEGRMPPHYITAVLASVAVMLSFALLLFLAWRINCMEAEIHDLSLRDALTDLYNVRGFHLLSEQALRMARRSKLPFSVLYIDLDDLKRTNDTLGHQAGSELLMETGKILKSSFRETDIVGRIGGDEFTVAGQFSSTGISLAAQRVEEAVERRNAANHGGPTLSLSMGYITSESPRQESLDELLARADRAMYESKRHKKMAVR